MHKKFPETEEYIRARCQEDQTRVEFGKTAQRLGSFIFGPMSQLDFHRPYFQINRQVNQVVLFYHSPSNTPGPPCKFAAAIRNPVEYPGRFVSLARILIDSGHPALSAGNITRALDWYANLFSGMNKVPELALEVQKNHRPKNFKPPLDD